MKKKILCGVLFLMVLFCISFSQTHLAAAGLSGTEPGSGLSGINPGSVLPDAIPDSGPSETGPGSGLPGAVSGSILSEAGPAEDLPETDSVSGTVSGTEPDAFPEGSVSSSLSGGDAGPSIENIDPSGNGIGLSGNDTGLSGSNIELSGNDTGLSGSNTGFSAETSSTAPDAQPGADMNGAQVASGSLPGLPSASTPEPIENKAAVDGEYTLSLTTSIGTLTYYNQSDSRWANYLYGGADPLAVYGCGPTVLAMLVTSFTEHTCQPPDIAAWAAANHYWSLGYGTKHEFIPEGAAAFGLKAESFRNFTPEGVISELKSGHILVALMGPGHFSDSGHFIIITDDWSGNQVRVADPARLERTQAAWDVEIILNELLSTATGGGPVWSITPK